MPDGTSKLLRHYTISPETERIIRTLADAQFDGNASMAVRAMIRHFAECQNRRPGNEPEPILQPQPEGA